MSGYSSRNNKPAVIFIVGLCQYWKHPNRFWSQSGHRSGFGVYWGPNHPLNVSRSLPECQSSTRAEIHAAIKALIDAKNHDTRSVILCTDNQFLHDVASLWHGSNQEFENELMGVLHSTENELDVDWRRVYEYNAGLGYRKAMELALDGMMRCAWR